MDGVLADVYSRFFELQEQQSGIRLTVMDVAGKLEAEAFPNEVKWITSHGFIRTVPVIKGSIEGLRKLNENFEVIVVSLATEFPQSLTDKQLWVYDHFPFIRWQQMVFCGNKNLLQADIMIDDHLKNLDNFKGETIMYSQPHNLNINHARHKRVHSWAEIEKLLLPKYRPGQVRRS